MIPMKAKTHIHAHAPLVLAGCPGQSARHPAAVHALHAAADPFGD